MAESSTPASAHEKLASSRSDLLVAMGYVQSPADDQLQLLQKPPQTQGGKFAKRLSSTLGQSVLGHWWHRHPLSSVVELGRPIMAHYAHEHPGKLMVYGAGTGALLWMLKPWRLLSLATILTLAVRTSDLTGLISNALHPSSDNKETDLLGNSPIGPRE